MCRMGDLVAADTYLHEALEMAMDMGAVPLTLDIVATVAAVLKEKGRYEQVAELIGLAHNHPSTYYEVTQQCIQLLDELRKVMSQEAMTAALERGKKLDLAPTAQKIINREL
jgi:hypothetical protein